MYVLGCDRILAIVIADAFVFNQIGFWGPKYKSRGSFVNVSLGHLERLVGFWREDKSALRLSLGTF